MRFSTTTLFAMLCGCDDITAGRRPGAGVHDVRGCVTRAEFKLVRVGVRVTRVHEIFGRRGD
jgi:hypothetical protein